LHSFTSGITFIFCIPDIDGARQTRFSARHVVIGDCRDLVMLQKIMVHGSEVKYDTYRSCCPEKYTSTILLSAQNAHVRKCALHTGTHAIAKNDTTTKKSGIFEKRSGMASGKRSECISTQHRF